MRKKIVHYLEKVSLLRITDNWVHNTISVFTNHHYSRIVRSAFCPNEFDQTIIADFYWDHPKIDLTSKKTLHLWTLQVGSSV